MIVIVDYGIGNLGSILNMFKKIGISAMISADQEQIANAEKIVLPGVGAFDTAIQKINDSGFYDILNKKANVEKIPVLGICLGMQLLTRGSEEGKYPGFNWINADTRRFSFDEASLKVPHMGWNTVNIATQNKILGADDQEQRFYFVHSYYVKANEDRYVLGKTHYGIEFDSVITNGDNIFGAQFHPEKSHKCGMRLLENFARL